VNPACPEGFRAIGNWFLKSKAAQAERQMFQQTGGGTDSGNSVDKRPPLQNPRQQNPRSLLEAVPHLAVGLTGKGGAAGGLANLLAGVTRSSGSTGVPAEKTPAVRTLLPIKKHKEDNADSPADDPRRRTASFWQSSLGRAAATAVVKRPPSSSDQGASYSKSGGVGRRGIASRRAGRSPRRRSDVAKSRSSSAGRRTRTRDARRRIGSASSGRRVRSRKHGKDRRDVQEATRGQGRSGKQRKRPRSRSSSGSGHRPHVRRGGQTVRSARSPARKTTRRRETRACSSSSDTRGVLDSDLCKRIQRVLER